MYQTDFVAVHGIQRIWQFGTVHGDAVVVVGAQVVVVVVGAAVVVVVVVGHPVVVVGPAVVGAAVVGTPVVVVVVVPQTVWISLPQDGLFLSWCGIDCSVPQS